MLKQIFLDIENKLKTIKNAENEPLFQFFDLWNRQVEFMEQESGLLFPACFIEFLPISWKNQSQKVQDADLSIRLHIVTEWFADTFDKTPENIRQKSLEMLDLENRVFKALQHFTPTNCNGFMRTQTVINHDHEGCVDTRQEYICNMLDYSALEADEQNYEYVMVQPQIIVN
jgi:hypothetical protein